MKYSLFLGCTVPTRARNYEMAARKIANHFNLPFVDIHDFNCCGFPVKSTDQELCLLMSAANLAQAQQKNVGICTLCSACTAMLAETNHIIESNPEKLKWINSHLHSVGLTLNGPVKIRHFSRLLLEDVGPETLALNISQPLIGFTFAPHYGCHYLKPSHVHDTFDSVEQPDSLQTLIELTGANCANLDFRKDCCGGAVLAVEPEITYRLAQRKLTQLKEKQVDAMAVICPFCAVVYDDNQKSIEKWMETEFNIPVLYYPQILGLAMGFDANELGLKQNKVKTKELLKRIQETWSNE